MTLIGEIINSEHINVYEILARNIPCTDFSDTIIVDLLEQQIVITLEKAEHDLESFNIAFP